MGIHLPHTTISKVCNSQENISIWYVVVSIGFHLDLHHKLTLSLFDNGNRVKLVIS
jgi:hypothetical protein